MAKKLMINCATCDARNIAEENYAHYEQITLNCAVMLTDPEAKAVMNRLPFTVNCASAPLVEKDVDLRIINGNGEIKNSDAVPAAKYYMVVNGALTVGEDTHKQLAQCVGMTVNGSLTCPQSVYTALTGVTVNGSTTCYPDGAAVLNSTAVIDKLFVLRAKHGLYWSARRMIMADPALNAEELKAKGVTFSTGEAIVVQSKLETLIDLIDEKAQIVAVPDGTAVVQDDIVLDGDALHRYGNRLYVIGDVTVADDADVLDGLAYLNVRGNIKVSEDLKEKLLKVLTDVSGKIKTKKPGGAVLADKPFVKVTAWMLEKQPLGMEINDCAVVEIAGDIPKDLIAQRLRIEDCGVVQCSKDLEDAVAMVCTDVGHIGSREGGMGDIVKSAMGGIKGALETKFINAAEYVL